MKSSWLSLFITVALIEWVCGGYVRANLTPVGLVQQSVIEIDPFFEAGSGGFEEYFRCGTTGILSSPPLSYPVSVRENPSTSAGHSDLSVQELPAVPRAFFMALVGFLCVTLVRDRKYWGMILTSVLLSGFAGVERLPRLWSCLTRCNSERQVGLGVIDQKIDKDDPYFWIAQADERNYLDLVHQLGEVSRESVYSNSRGVWLRIRELERVWDESLKRPSFFGSKYIPANCSWDDGLVICRVSRDGGMEKTRIFSGAYFQELFPRGPPGRFLTGI